MFFPLVMLYGIYFTFLPRQFLGYELEEKQYNIFRHWWRSVTGTGGAVLPALVAQCTGTGGAVYRHWWRSVPALVAQCVKGLLPR
jgi:hypothetical protein